VEENSDFAPEDANRVFDPGGYSGIAEYCSTFRVNDSALHEFSLYLSSAARCVEQCENHDLLSLRNSWHWNDACDPPERDSLIPVNPGFIRCMYFQWSLDFMTYDLPMAVDLLSRYDASCSPFNPQQLSPKPPLPTLPPEISQRVQLALRLAGRLRGTPLDSQLAYDFFCEAALCSS